MLLVAPSGASAGAGAAAVMFDVVAGLSDFTLDAIVIDLGTISGSVDIAVYKLPGATRAAVPCCKSG